MNRIRKGDWGLEIFDEGFSEGICYDFYVGYR